MATDCRRCFGATSCNCIIQAGVGTTINGDGTALDPYVIDADGGAAANTSVLTPVTSFGNVIARHDDGAGNVVDITESVVEFSRIVNIDGSQTITALPEDNAPFTFTIPAASGGNTSIVTPALAGHVIATHDDGSGTVVDIEESIVTVNVVTDAAAGSRTVEITNEDSVTISFGYDNPCGVSATNGQTGTRSGLFVDGCFALDLAGASDPETANPAAGFSDGWRQRFTNGVTGSEVWIVLADVNGDLQWHQVA